MAHKTGTGRRLKVEECKHFQSMIQMNLWPSNGHNYEGTKKSLLFHTISGLGKAWGRVKTQKLDSFQLLLSQGPLLWFHYDP